MDNFGKLKKFRKDIFCRTRRIKTIAQINYDFKKYEILKTGFYM